MEAQFGKEFDNKYQNILPKMNGEYAFLSLSSVCLTVLTVLFGVYSFARDYDERYGLILYLLGAVVVITVEIILFLKIRRMASLKDFQNMRQDMLQEWKLFAEKRGYIASSNKDITKKKKDC